MSPEAPELQVDSLLLSHLGNLHYAHLTLNEPRIEPGSSALQVDSLPAELPRKPQSIEIQYIFSLTF